MTFFEFGAGCYWIGLSQRRLFYYFAGIERFNGDDMSFPRLALFWAILGIGAGSHALWRYIYLP